MKRLFDFLFSIFLLIILSPILLMIAILIRLESPGPALFKQERVGEDEERFICYKFRTMQHDTPDIATNKFINRKEYLTTAGYFLRKYSLDELPQLFNIIKGNMSIVGPRPVIPEEEELVSKRSRAGVYSLKPGVTGWAQINGRDHVNIDEKVELDSYYLEKQSFFFDIKIILKTALCVIKREGILEHSSGVEQQEISK